MLNRIRRRLNAPLVISTIALFAALGGGYAVAVSGSGSLSVTSKDPTSEFTKLKSVPGIGNLQHRCDGGDLDIRLKNTKGAAELMTSVLSDFDTEGEFNLSPVQSGGTGHLVSMDNGAGQATIHMSKNKNDPKQPQAVATVQGLSVAPGCTTATVETRVMVLASE